MLTEDYLLAQPNERLLWRNRLDIQEKLLKL